MTSYIICSAMSSPRPVSLTLRPRAAGDKTPQNSPSSPVKNGPRPEFRKPLSKSDIQYMSVPPPRLSSETSYSPPVRPNTTIELVSPVSPRSNSANVEVRKSPSSPDAENVPEGYEARKCFVNSYNGEVWFPAWDANGQVYYYQVSGGF